MDTKSHWEHIYQSKAASAVSWYQAHPQLSLQLIRSTAVPETAPIIDVGGGASTLVDDLLAAGFRRITVLDLSALALQHARRRLGPRAAEVTWLEADITQAQLPRHFYQVWHDRAVFHFLTRAEDRQGYVKVLQQAVCPGGHVVMATFAPDGPLKCSGLDVVRYSPGSLLAELGSSFELVDSAREAHQTPSGAEQRFVYCHFVARI